MTSSLNTREIILGTLIEITEEEVFCHIAIRQVLEKYQYMTKQDRAFMTRVIEGTVEYMTQIDYIIEQFSSIKVDKMKPVIRNIIRSAVYQMKFMDRVPNSAVCNEAVKLAQRKGFYNLKGFVNGVLRTIAREIDNVEYPKEEDDPALFLSVTYSMPMWIVEKWLKQFKPGTVKKILEDFQTIKPTSVRCNLNKASEAEIIKKLRAQDIEVKKAPYVEGALYICNYNYIKAVQAFRDGLIQVQDVSSMLAGEVADPKWGDYVIDVCAAPGGKSLHVADKLKGSGQVEARDLTDQKVELIQENIDRIDLINMKAVTWDATVFDEASVDKADIVLADLPCSGLGVIGKKADIKYNMTPVKQQELVLLQRKILHSIHNYVKVGGVLIYSTCTIGADENQANVKWFLENYPYKLENIEPYLDEKLHCKTTKAGYLQLLPGVHGTDGFFIARLKRVE